MAKNECAKMRKVNAPYEIWTDGSWYWQVLKKWQADDNKPYGRWFCAVKSPFTAPSFDMGDVYVNEIKNNARKLSEQEMSEYLAINQW